MLKLSKVFPIQNSSACVLKWGWNTFRMFTGTSSSCHRVASEFVPIERFDNFHNMPQVLNDRALMRQGQWPVGRGCEYCQDVEKTHGLSDRLYHNQLPDQAPVDFGDSDHVIPRISEIYLDNVCDLACVYCIPNFSSRINQELATHGSNVVGLSHISKSVDSDRYFNAYLNWLDQNIHNLSRICIQGGEPMLQKNLWVLLDFLRSKKNTNLEINVNSNLNSSLSTIQQYVESMKQLIKDRSIRRADIQCSLDCWGPQAEFIRHGLDLEQWQQNFEYLISHKWLKVSIHQVISSLSVKTLGDFQQRINSWKQINPQISQECFTVDGKNQVTLHPEIFGKEFFSKTMSHLVDQFACANQQDQVNKDRLIGIVKTQASCDVDVPRLKKLQQTLDQLDQRRKTNWRLLWPEIDEFFVSNNIYA